MHCATLEDWGAQRAGGVRGKLRKVGAWVEAVKDAVAPLKTSSVQRGVLIVVLICRKFVALAGVAQCIDC